MNDFEERPETKILAPDSARIISAVCKEYKIEETELYVTRRGHFNEPRKVAIYLSRRLKNDTLKKVGEQFGIEKYSTGSSIIERVKHEMDIDKGLKNRVQILFEKIIKRSAHLKGRRDPFFSYSERMYAALYKRAAYNM
jgi:chromosomal replication initiation ATPase DnaA